MGSAKSLRLLTTAYNFEENGIPFMVLKPSIDTRDGEGIIKSRVGIERECIMVDPNMTVEKAHKLSHDIEDKIREITNNNSQVIVHIEPYYYDE